MQQNLYVRNLGGVEIDIPPIAEQRRIRRILACLDDKIELNRQMNETLEAMALAIFQSWFIDFDPVRAKVSGRVRCDSRPSRHSLSQSFREF